MSSHSRIRSRASRAVTTTEPSSSPASAHLPGNASSSAILLHWQLSTCRHTSRGYQLSAALARVSPPVPSWNTAPPGDLRQSLPRRGEPVRHRDAAARVEPEPPGQPAAQAEDLHPVPYAAAWVASDAERHRIAAEHLRQPAPEHLVDRPADPLRVLVVQEHQQPRPPVVVGGPLGVEPEHLRPRPDQRRRVPQPWELRLQQRPDNLGKELTRQPHPRHEPTTHLADTALSGPSGHLVFPPQVVPSRPGPSLPATAPPPQKPRQPHSRHSGRQAQPRQCDSVVVLTTAM